MKSLCRNSDRFLKHPYFIQYTTLVPISSDHSFLQNNTYCKSNIKLIPSRFRFQWRSTEAASFLLSKKERFLCHPGHWCKSSGHYGHQCDVRRCRLLNEYYRGESQESRERASHECPEDRRIQEMHQK